MNRDDFTAAVESAFLQIAGPLTSSPTQKVEEPLSEGKWSLKDMVAHFIFWDGIVVRALEAIYHRLPFDWNEYSNWDALNAQAVEERRGTPVKRVAAEWRITHMTMMEALSRVPDERLLENGEIPRWLRENVLEHYAYHASQVDEFLKRREE